MESFTPPETPSDAQLETGNPGSSNTFANLELPAEVLAEINAVLGATPDPPSPPVEPQDPPPGRRVSLLRETQWTVIMPPWQTLMQLTPVREPTNQRVIVIKEALNLKDYLDTRIRQRIAMLAHAVGVRATPECTQCAQGKGQFVGCVVVPDLLDGACANCVWEKSRSRRGQCSFRKFDGGLWLGYGDVLQKKADFGAPVVEKENLEEALKHEQKMQNGGDQTFSGVWKLDKS